MLKQLLIKNIAIIESLSLDFKAGLTVITGESGSGKSILLDAIALAFGARVSPREVLRNGAERGQVELLFDLGKLTENPEFQAFLAGQGIALNPDETELLLSRELTMGGSRSRINGVPVPREVLEQLRPWVIDLHGQHELTSLFHRDSQRAYLDALGGSEVAYCKRQVAAAYDEWLSLRQQLENLERNREQIEQQRDFMVFQLQELQAADLTNPDEDVETKQAIETLAHAEKLIQVALQGAAALCEGDAQGPAMLDQLSRLEKRLNEGARHDPFLEALAERLQGAVAELRELAAELSRYADRVEANPQRLAELTERLDLLEKLKRKYGPTLAAAIQKRAELEEALETIELGAQNADALKAALQDKEARLESLCRKLSELRLQAATNLKTRLMEQLQVLALPAAAFDIRFEPTPCSRHGAENVEFLFSANPGEPLRPLAKVASGGELSRFLLALKVLTAENDGLLTLIFDEIDTGISGPTAKAVAEKLAELSLHLQVLTITHQPMIAAMGRQHWHVEKMLIASPEGQEGVTVMVQALEENESERLKVLSRLVSGFETGDAAAEQFIRRLREQAAAFYRDASGVLAKA
jgi:DNA repair protein RecN (Recombination protein N)